MKSIYKFATVILTIIALNNINLGNFHQQTCLSATHIPTDKVTCDNTAITHQQTKAQVHFFQQALDELGANSPEQVIEIWVKAERTRNGVFHYAVACDKLKSEIIKNWGDPEESFWIIGGSSPWLDKYEIIYNKKLSDSLVEVKIKFYWTTSYSPAETTETTLIITKNGDIWCVKEVK